MNRYVTFFGALQGKHRERDRLMGCGDGLRRRALSQALDRSMPLPSAHTDYTAAGARARYAKEFSKEPGNFAIVQASGVEDAKKYAHMYVVAAVFDSNKSFK